jgi:hypothetical protein
MSQKNVEIVRRVFEAYEREGVVRAIAMFDPEVVWHPADEAPQHGIEAAIACMRRWEGEWEALSTVPEQFIDGGDTVLVAVRFPDVAGQAGSRSMISSTRSSPCGTAGSSGWMSSLSARRPSNPLAFGSRRCRRRIDREAAPQSRTLQHGPDSSAG